MRIIEFAKSGSDDSDCTRTIGDTQREGCRGRSQWSDRIGSQLPGTFDDLPAEERPMWPVRS